MDSSNLDNDNINSGSAIAKHMDHTNKTMKRLNYIKSRKTFLNSEHCNNVTNNDTYISNFKGSKRKKSIPVSISLDANSVQLARNSNHKIIYNTETYTTCLGQKLNVPMVSSQTQDIQSSLEACYLPNSIENLDTPSIPEVCSNYINNDDLSIHNGTNLKVNTERQYVEKATYCRPVLNLYNENFIFKTIEENVKLQRIIQRIMQNRLCEKRRNDWNNFINDLKNKHCYDDDNRVSQHCTGPESSNIIENYYNTKLNCKQFTPCKNLLYKIYGACSNIDNYYINKSKDNIQRIPKVNPYVFKNNSYCYPTSSQARLQMINNEKMRAKNTEGLTKTPNRDYRGNTIITDRDYLKTPNTDTISLVKYTADKAINVNLKTDLVSKRASVQNNLNMQQGEIKESLKDKVNLRTKNLERPREKVSKPKDRESLTNIENKLNHLLNAINAVLLEIKTNKTQSYTSIGVSCKFSNEEKPNKVKSDVCEISKLIKCKCSQSFAKSSVDFSDVSTTIRHCNSNTSRFNEILNEEIDKSNKIKKDIDRILSKKSEKPCCMIKELDESDKIKENTERALNKSEKQYTVQFTFDMPTKEQGTEVTESLSSAKSLDKGILIEDVHRESDRMTIAVNTDPLGLLALLRISTETVKQMLSCMPNIDYNSYLSMWQPQSRTEYHYVCNICGDAFTRPSQLSDHIRDHNLGKTR